MSTVGNSSSNNSKNVFQTVLKFMQDCNRPYSANDICERIGKENTKAAVINALDVLVGKNKILEKIYGKQKVFVIVQENADEEMLKIELRTLDDDIKRTEANVKIKEARVTELEKHFKLAASTLTKAEADAQKAELEVSVQKLREQVKVTKSQNVKFDPVEQKKVEKQYEKYTTTYRKRKRMCTDMLDAILEGYPKTKKHLLEEVGVETDEDAKFEMKKI